MIWAAISWYSAGCVITLNGRITAGDYVDILGNQVHPVVQIQFPNNDAIFQDDNSLMHSVRLGQSQFAGYEDALRHPPWPAQLPDFNITEPLWSVQTAG